jgi:cell pole-organizing protein PopZ
MSKAQAKDQPSVEELLASIREAIYADGEGQGGTGMSAAAHKAPRARKDAGQGAAPGKGAAAPATGRPPSPPQRTYNGAEPAALVPHGTMRGMRVSLDHGEGGAGRVSTRTDDFLNLRQRLTSLAEEGRSAEAKRTLVTSSLEGFTGILGGDVRLEEALARLSRAGRPPRSEEIARPLAPPPPPLAPRSRPLDAAAVEQLAGRELKPAIREAIDDELQALPRETGRAPAAAAVPQPEPPAYAEPVYAETYADAAGQGDDAPPAGAWDDGAPPPPQGWVDPGAHLPEGPPPGHGGWQAGPYPPAGYAQHQGYVPSEGYGQHQGYPPPMLAPDSAEQAGSAFNRLADTIMAHATGGERSIDDLTRELLRPMLKSWLDHNLPHVVERLVREEIQRVARRGSR